MSQILKHPKCLEREWTDDVLLFFCIHKKMTGEYVGVIIN